MTSFDRKIGFQISAQYDDFIGIIILISLHIHLHETLTFEFADNSDKQINRNGMYTFAFTFTFFTRKEICENNQDYFYY